MQFSLCFGACCQVTVLSDLFSLELVTPSLHRCSLYICTSFVAPQPFLHTVFTRFSPSATAKSPQSCPTLCDPTDGSPPGSPVPGILQARTPEWVAISFSSAGKWKVKAKSLSHVRLFATPWTAAHQALRPWDPPGKSTGVGCHLNSGNHGCCFFLAALGLHCFVWAFSSCAEQGLLFCCGARASHCGASVVEPRL